MPNTDTNRLKLAQAPEKKRYRNVRKAARRFTAIDRDERREILALWDMTRDPDYVGDRCGVQRAHVLTAVLDRLWDMRMGPQPAPGAVVPIRRTA